VLLKQPPELWFHHPRANLSRTLAELKSSPYLKQNLRIKTFVGTQRQRAAHPDLDALIAMLLLNTCNCGLAYVASLSNLWLCCAKNVCVRDLQAGWMNRSTAPPALAGLHDGQLS